MKCIVDMNLSPSWVRFLREASIEAQHWSTIGHPGAADSEVLAAAQARGAIVFTNDLDFGTLLVKAGSIGPSVLLVRTQDVLPEALGARLLAVLRACAAELEAGALVVIDDAAARVRVLPVRSRQ
jgi:predicted nuclease of predicted toxin-antitoxin system